MNKKPTLNNNTAILEHQLTTLNLKFMVQNYEACAEQAASEHLTHVDFLQRLVEGESLRRQDNRIKQRIRSAHFPVVKTLEQFDWEWPRKVNRSQVQNLFRLSFMKDNGNVIFLSSVGLGKTHLATALGYAACLAGHTVLFASTVDMINTLNAAQAAYRLKTEIRRYINPRILVLDELGYLPIDKQGADLLFQVISQRYERGSIILTTNTPFKNWPAIFNNDSGITSAVLDRLLHHAETVILEGKSYRMKDQIET
jgi:DNA replication protein DnaC